MKNEKYSAVIHRMPYGRHGQVYYAIMACAIMLAGCARQQQYEAVEKICVPGIDKAAAMQVAEDVLVKLHFTIDKADPNAGFIKTQPLPGAQFFEIWRKDSIGPENEALSNLHTIRRVVELNVSRDEKELCIVCDAQIYRLSLPQRESTSKARSAGMFSESSRATQVLQLRHTDRRKGRQAPSWINLGRDEQLTTNILKRIEKRLLSQAGHEQFAAGGEK